MMDNKKKTPIEFDTTIHMPGDSLNKTDRVKIKEKEEKNKNQRRTHLDWIRINNAHIDQ